MAFRVGLILNIVLFILPWGLAHATVGDLSQDPAPFAAYKAHLQTSIDEQSSQLQTCANNLLSPLKTYTQKSQRVELLTKHLSSPNLAKFNQDYSLLTDVTTEDSLNYWRLINQPGFHSGKMVIEFDLSTLKYINDFDKVFATTLTNYGIKTFVERFKENFGGEIFTQSLKAVGPKFINIVLADTQENHQKLRTTYATTVWTIQDHLKRDFPDFLQLIAPNGHTSMSANIITSFNLGVGYGPNAHAMANRALKKSRGDYKNRLKLNRQEWLTGDAPLYADSRKSEASFLFTAIEWNNIRILLTRGELKGTELLTQNDLGDDILSLAALNTIRSNEGKRLTRWASIRNGGTGSEYADTLKERLEQIFNVELTANTVFNMIDYYHNLDTMLPPYFATREDVLLDPSAKAVLSADLKMGGAINALNVSAKIAATLGPTILPPDNLKYDQILTSAIAGVDEATEYFDQWKSIIPATLFQPFSKNTKIKIIGFKTYNGISWFDQMKYLAGNTMRFFTKSGDDVTGESMIHFKREDVIRIGTKMSQLPKSLWLYTRLTFNNLSRSHFLGKPQRAIETSEDILKKIDEAFNRYLPDSISPPFSMLYTDRKGNEIHFFTEQILPKKIKNELELAIKQANLKIIPVYHLTN